MTPRQQDVAFVLESVAGVLDVYAVAKAGVDLEFAVHLEQGAGKLAAAYCALLRVLKRDECHRVLFFETRLPPGLERASSRLELSDEERSESCARLPERAPDEPIPPKLGRSGAQFAALLVGCTGEDYRSVVTALGVAARRVIESDPRVGVVRALSEDFDVLLCSAHVAFGRLGFLEFLHVQAPLLVSRVVLVAAPEERDLVIARLEQGGRYNTCLVTPVDPTLILEIARTGFVVLPWSIPVPPASRAPAAQRAPAPKLLRVLVIDDDLEAQALNTRQSALFKVDIAQDAWAALDYLAADPPDLVLCSSSLRSGVKPLYRLLWDAHPELKPRFMLIASRKDLGDGGSPQRWLVERPLTTERIVEALRRCGRL